MLCCKELCCATAAAVWLCPPNTVVHNSAARHYDAPSSRSPLLSSVVYVQKIKQINKSKNKSAKKKACLLLQLAVLDALDLKVICQDLHSGLGLAALLPQGLGLPQCCVQRRRQISRLARGPRSENKLHTVGNGESHFAVATSVSPTFVVYTKKIQPLFLGLAKNGELSNIFGGHTPRHGQVQG